MFLSDVRLLVAWFKAYYEVEVGDTHLPSKFFHEQVDLYLNGDTSVNLCDHTVEFFRDLQRCAAFSKESESFKTFERP